MTIWLTYVLEWLSSIVIKPYPTTNMAHDIHITSRYSLVLETTIPDMADIKAEPRENGSIRTPDPVADAPKIW